MFCEPEGRQALSEPGSNCMLPGLHLLGPFFCASVKSSLVLGDAQRGISVIWGVQFSPNRICCIVFLLSASVAHLVMGKQSRLHCPAAGRQLALMSWAPHPQTLPPRLPLSAGLYPSATPVGFPLPSPFPSPGTVLVSTYSPSGPQPLHLPRARAPYSVPDLYLIPPKRFPACR